MIDDSSPYILTIDHVLSENECYELIQRIEQAKPTPAPINTVHGEQRNSNVRNNDRTIMNNVTLATDLFDRIKDQLPQYIFSHQLKGLNELFRCYRYTPGMKFAPHADGSYIRSETEKSFYSFLIYLNEVEKGGLTNFLVEPEVSIIPEQGLGLVFQHPIIHEGAVVTKGTKYVLRTDVMYIKKPI